MFQFPTFPAQDYGFILRSMILHHSGFPIRKSADRGLFTAPRGLSQLVTSFIGSWCQGIHLMLFIAWTLFCFVLYKLLFAIYCLSFVSIIFFSWIVTLDCEKAMLFNLWVFHLDFDFSLSWRIVVIHDSWKDRLYWIKFNLLITVFLNYLFVLLFCFIRFSMNICICKTLRVLLVGSNGLEPSTSRLSGARSNHLSYEPI